VFAHKDASEFAGDTDRCSSMSINRTPMRVAATAPASWTRFAASWRCAPPADRSGVACHALTYGRDHRANTWVRPWCIGSTSSLDRHGCRIP